MPPRWKEESKQTYLLPKHRGRYTFEQVNYFTGIQVNFLAYYNISKKGYADYVASCLHALMKIVAEQIADVFKESSGIKEMDCIILSGGVAFNQRPVTYLSEKFDMLVFVPSTPNDVNQAIGGAILGRIRYSGVLHTP
mmetsp:Transcript_141249/g.246282  ORF Transcript_141249/g.246282 Transcript_141249/m.246282 type:complete len:138 (-) Transcript_141249:575-988(-)